MYVHMVYNRKKRIFDYDHKSVIFESMSYQKIMVVVNL